MAAGGGRGKGGGGSLPVPPAPMTATATEVLQAGNGAGSQLLALGSGTGVAAELWAGGTSRARMSSRKQKKQQPNRGKKSVQVHPPATNSVGDKKCRHTAVRAAF